MNRIDSDENIFDPEIIYYVTKIIIEPFITCNYDRDKYKNGEDCVFSFSKSSSSNSDNPKYLCISFGEELSISNSSFGIVKKGTHKSLGTIFIFNENGGEIILNRPLTNIASLYYSYIHSSEEFHDFKKTILISESDRKESQNKTIYILNVDKIIYKEDIRMLEIERIPIGRWIQSSEEYPNQIEIKGYNNKIIKYGESPLAEIMSESKDSYDYMDNSLPNIDDEIVNNIHPPTPRPQQINELEEKGVNDVETDSNVAKTQNFGCIKYFLNCCKPNKPK